MVKMPLGSTTVKHEELGGIYNRILNRKCVGNVFFEQKKEVIM